ncbi:MAG: hypothetical protein IAI50_16475 [Candidatus Eremiobacteraeota bacterium]|nr:hypothetical protein [Candidatus Eremiobacteraeota bacterium]
MFVRVTGRVEDGAWTLGRYDCGMPKEVCRPRVTAGSSLALAFTGGLSSALALGLALLDCEPFAAACGIVMTTYCAAEFIMRSSAEIDQV